MVIQLRIFVGALAIVVVAAVAFSFSFDFRSYIHAIVQEAERHSKEVQVPLSERLLELGLAEGDEVFVRIFKEESELEIWMRRHGSQDRYELVKTYPICTWSGSLGPKLAEGDRQAPEGFYFTNLGRLNPNSAYHLSFDIGYPNAYDRAHGRTGSYIMVHGNCVSLGCFAMTDPGIEEIYGLVEAALQNGQSIVRIHSFPFRITDDRLAREASNEWLSFWKNLRGGYDWFEREGIPPNVEVREKRYVFAEIVSR
ncbi:MAG: murein L,D-transpeptidase family protein [Verrucomicrobiota bacterium]